MLYGRPSKKSAKGWINLKLFRNRYMLDYEWQKRIKVKENN